MTDQTIQDALYLIDAWERGAYAEKYPNEIQALRQALAQPERKWVGLTEDELAESLDINLGEYDLCLEIEDKLREKNT